MPAPEIRIVRDRGGAEALRADWEALWARSPGASAAQDAEYVLGGWDLVARDPACALAMVAAYRGERLVGLWPLFVRRTRGHSVANHLGSGDDHEYAAPLVDGDETSDEALRAMFAAAQGLADILRLYNLPTPGRTSDIAAGAPGLSRRSTTHSPVTNLRGVADWDSWAAGKSKSFRAGLRYERKRLGERGALTFDLLAGPQDGPACIEWIFRQKRAWATARGIRHSFVEDPLNEAFFTALASRPARSDGRPADMEAYALRLDGQIIAACILLNSHDRMEFHTTAFEPELAAFSPGMVMMQDCVTLAIARGVDFDMRLMHQGYKARWGDREDRFDSFMFACTRRGELALRLEGFGLAIHRFRAKWGPRVKGWLKRSKAATSESGR